MRWPPWATAKPDETRRTLERADRIQGELRAVVVSVRAVLEQLRRESEEGGRPDGHA